MSSRGEAEAAAAVAAAAAAVAAAAAKAAAEDEAAARIELAGVRAGCSRDSDSDSPSRAASPSSDVSSEDFDSGLYEGASRRSRSAAGYDAATTREKRKHEKIIQELPPAKLRALEQLGDPLPAPCPTRAPEAADAPPTAVDDSAGDVPMLLPAHLAAALARREEELAQRELDLAALAEALSKRARDADARDDDDATFRRANPEYVDDLNLLEAAHGDDEDREALRDAFRAPRMIQRLCSALDEPTLRHARDAFAQEMVARAATAGASVGGGGDSACALARGPSPAITGQDQASREHDEYGRSRDSKEHKKMNDEQLKELLKELRRFVVKCGGSASTVTGWRAAYRRDGNQGRLRVIYLSPGEDTFKSRPAVARHLGLDVREHFEASNGQFVQSKPVQQISMKTGRVLSVWPSTRAAADAVGLKSSGGISSTARGGAGCQNSAGGFRWAYVDDVEDEEEDEAETDEEEMRADRRARSVKQVCSETGRVLNIWPSAAAAAEAVGLKSDSSINKVCRGSRKISGGFQWEFVDDDEEEDEAETDEEEMRADRRARSVKQVCSETGRVLNIWPSAAAAAEAVGLKSDSSINKVCRGSRKISGGFQWEFVDDDDRDNEAVPVAPAPMCGACQYGRHSAHTCGIRGSKRALADVPTHNLIPSRDEEEAADARPYTLSSSRQVRITAHPLLRDQRGLFATSAIARGEWCFAEILPRLAQLPAALEGSDRYIARILPSSRQEYLIADDDDRTSMTYFLNSSWKCDDAINPLDPHGRGKNVELSVDPVAGSPGQALVTFRARRPIAEGEELLWDYQFEPRASASAPRDHSPRYKHSLGALLAGGRDREPPPPRPRAAKVAAAVEEPPFMSWVPAQFVGAQFDERFPSYGWFRATVLSVSDGTTRIRNHKGAELVVAPGDLVVRYDDGNYERRSVHKLRGLMKRPKPENATYYPFVTSDTPDDARGADDARGVDDARGAAEAPLSITGATALRAALEAIGHEALVAALVEPGNSLPGPHILQRHS